MEAYPNQSEPILEALPYMTSLSFDMMMFIVVERLASDGRHKVKDDGVNIADWLQARARRLDFLTTLPERHATCSAQMRLRAWLCCRLQGRQAACALHCLVTPERGAIWRPLLCAVAVLNVASPD